MADELLTGDLPTDGLLEALFAHAPIGVGYVDADLRYQRVNAELAAMHGISVEDHVGRRPSELLPELGPRLEAVFARVIESGQPLRDIDISGRTPASADDRQWLASYFPVRGDDGAIEGMMALVIEVTRGARFVDAELRALYGALPVGVAFLSPELRYLRVNETLARLNGHPVEAHLGASLEDIIGDAAALVRPALEQVAETREALSFDATVPLPTDPDTTVTLEAVYFPVVGADDRLLGLGGVVVDVTRRHALEVEQARLLEEAERGRTRIAFLADAGARMAASVEWEATLRAVVRSAVPDIADWASLTVAEEGGGVRVAAVAHRDPEQERLAWELIERYPRAEKNQAAVAMRTGETIVFEDIARELLVESATDEEHLRLLEQLDIRHGVVAPLISPAGPIGALTFVLGESGRRFEPDDLTLIRSLTTRAALHLQNARLYRERSHVAETLEASLRPRALPAIPGVEIAAAYRPAGDQRGAGGDFYDVFAGGDGALTAIVGDVSGKGPEAAAITATARHTLRAVSMLEEAPAVNLTCLNAALRTDAGSDRFCTAFYARIWPRDDGLDLRYASAGHPPPLVVRADGRIEELEGGHGPLAGATADAHYTEAQEHLAPGELLLLYTDGVTEISTDDMRRGEAELRTTLGSLRGATAADVVAAIEERVVALQDGTARDDIALVALRVPPA